MPRLFDATETEVVEYRALSALAVVGLVVGVLSAAVFLNVALLFLPIVGIGLNLLALWRIHTQAPALIGRKAAVAGLVLSTGFAAAVTFDWVVYRQMVRSEARQFAATWFDLLSRGEKEQAHQLSLEPNHRRTGATQLREYYREGRGHDDLKNYLAQPSVRLLLELGPKAEVRYYETLDQGHAENRDWAQLVYEVTYDEGGNRKTTYVTLVLARINLDEDRASWRIASVGEGILAEQ